MADVLDFFTWWRSVAWLRLPRKNCDFFFILLLLSVFICYLISIELDCLLLLSVFICYLISIGLDCLLLLLVFICCLISIELDSMLPLSAFVISLWWTLPLLVYCLTSALRWFVWIEKTKIIEALETDLEKTRELLKISK